MIKFDYTTDESENSFIQSLSSFNTVERMPFDDCYIEIRTANNKVSASIMCNEFKMYKINDTEYAYYPSIFKRTNVNAKVLTDKQGKTHLKGQLIPHFTQIISLIIPIILAIIVMIVPTFHINLLINSSFVTIVLIGIAVLFLVHTIMHAAFSGARLKKFLKFQSENDQ